MRRRRSRPRPLATAAALCAAAAILGGALVFGPHTGEGRTVTVERGASLWDIGRALDDSGAVSSGALFALAAKLSGKGGRMQSGTYRFPDDLTMAGIIDAIAAGHYQVEVWITIPEGSTTRTIARILAARLRLSDTAFLRLTRDPSLLRSHGIRASSFEGYLFPDTYLFRVDETALSALEKMHARFRASVTADMRARARTMRRSFHEILTMASIVEGETRLGSERARVAGVYYNRLARGMRLQADPTVQYIIPDGPRRLLYRDLRIDSPYNTYKHRGLPPGPINNPGLAAIRAALDPEKHEYIFFVADGTGGHRFSRTAAEHERAVRDYRALQREAR